MQSPEQKIKAREKRLAKYGLTIESYAALLASQHGVCKICGRPPKKVSLNVDHDHALEKNGTMFVRGLLCAICNHKILGVIERFRVNPQKIVDYLTAASEKYEASSGLRPPLDSVTANLPGLSGSC